MNYPTYYFERSTTSAARPDTPAFQEDQSIIRARSGDLSAFNQLVLAYQDIVFSQAFWILKEENAAEDAVQDSFIMAYRKLGTFRGGSFRSWILRITTNYCLDYIRSAQRRPSVPLDPTDIYGHEIEPIWMKDPRETPEQLMERSEANEMISLTIQNLSFESRMVVLLIDLQDLNYIEASNVLHIPVGTVKSRLARARRKLSENLQVSWNS